MKIFFSIQGALGKLGKGAANGQDGLYPNDVQNSISATNITKKQMVQTIGKYIEFAKSKIKNHVRPMKLKKFIEKMQQQQQHLQLEQTEINHDEM